MKSFQSLYLVVAVLAACGNAHAQLFSEVNSLEGTNWGSLAWGDYNNDGKLDILLTGAVRDGNIYSRAYSGDGNGGFATAYDAMGVYHYGSCVWGDYNNDGFLDFLIAGDIKVPNPPAITVTKLYRNNKNGGFDHVRDFPGVNGPLAWGDFDNDGDLDIWVGSGHLYRNDKRDDFVEVQQSVVNGQQGGTWGDYDNDGDLDIVGIGNVLRNDGGIFTIISLGLPGNGNSEVSLGDYNSDGYLDVLFGGDGITEIYENYFDSGEQQRKFRPLSAGLQPIHRGGVALGDYNNDGDLDALVTGFRNSVPGDPGTMLYQNNQGSFSEISFTGLTNLGYSSVAWGDYGNDGSLDLVLSGTVSLTPDVRKAPVFRNNNNPAFKNNPPSPPTGLTASVSSNSVTFSWNKSTDSRTAQDGLTYNLRVGTIHNGVEIVSPMADPGTGRRRIPALGNVNHNTSWTIKNLVDGQKYYWSVQAIDNSFAGSRFADEEIFKIENRDPEVQQAVGSRTSRANAPVFTYDLNTTFRDSDGDVLTYEATSTSTSVATANISGSALMVKPLGIGKARITVVARDGNGGRCSHEFDVTVTEIKRAIVKIGDKQKGTGIVIGSSNNTAYILTAYHVVVDTGIIIEVAFFDRQEQNFIGIPYRYDNVLDIAVIKIDMTRGNELTIDLPSFTVGDVENLERGDAVSTIGHPLDNDWFQCSSAFLEPGYKYDSRKFLIKSETCINRGNSGGPVFDDRGALVGMILNQEPIVAFVAVKIKEALWVLNKWSVPTTKLDHQ